jgi:uncharacterized membrane protein
MIRIFAAFFIAFCFSCSDPSAEKKVIAQDTLLTRESRAPEPVTDSTKIILTARGSEPGWYAEVYSNRLRLQYNYGKDSLLMYYNFSGILLDEHFTLDMRQAESKFYLEIIKEDCIESGSGEKRERKMIVETGAAKLAGCVTVAPN